MKKCVIWGTGKVGQSTVLKEIIEREYAIVAYCDSNTDKVGTNVNFLEVISVEAVKNLVSKKEIDTIVLGVNNPKWVKEIFNYIRKEISKEVHLVDLLDEEMSNLENDYLLNKRYNLEYHWNVDFLGQSRMWMENLMSEVEFWIDKFAETKGSFLKSYLNNQNFLTFDSNCLNFERKLKENAIIMDIGSGIISKYGNRISNGVSVQVLAIDPLAHYYNQFLASSRTKEKMCEFGLFEFMADFYSENFCDGILINNALDHCIDPYKSIVECLYILKENAIIRTVHRRAEAVFEKYSGLHKWNIDYDNHNNFIIWNEENAINVTNALQNVADIKVNYSHEQENRAKQMVVVEITKKKSFALSDFIDEDIERYNLAHMIKDLMKYFAITDTNAIRELLKTVITGEIYADKV